MRGVRAPGVRRRWPPRHVDLWYGDADTLVPPQIGEYLARAIPDSRLKVLSGEGHMAYVTHWADILRALARAAA